MEHNVSRYRYTIIVMRTIALSSILARFRPSWVVFGLLSAASS
jgi:hypothetical protein